MPHASPVVQTYPYTNGTITTITTSDSSSITNTITAATRSVGQFTRESSGGTNKQKKGDACHAHGYNDDDKPLQQRLRENPLYPYSHPGAGVPSTPPRPRLSKFLDAGTPKGGGDQTSASAVTSRLPVRRHTPLARSLAATSCDPVPSPLYTPTLSLVDSDAATEVPPQHPAKQCKRYF